MLRWLKSLFSRSGPKTRAELNELVRAQLRGHGDTGVLPRPVTHYCYPFAEHAAAPEVISDFLSKDGFEIEPTHDGSGLVLGRTDRTAAKYFDPLTERLEGYLSTIGWEYDGWETEVRADNSENNEE